MADIIFNFLTTFYNEEGDTENNSKKVACRYFRRGFLFDALTLLPFEMLNSPELHLLAFLRIRRILRVRSILTRLRVSQIVKSRLAFLVIVLSIFLFYHLAACAWAFIGQGAWIPPSLWIDPSLALLPITTLYSYLLTLHYSLMGGLAAGEIGPCTGTEALFASLLMVLG